jgi:protein O-GlcNAc transferase
MAEVVQPMNPKPSPTTIPESYRQAIAALQAGNLPETERWARQLLVERPNHHAGLHLLGVVAYMSGKHPMALEMFGRAIAAAPQVPEYHVNMGLVLIAMNRPEDAIAAYRRAISLKSDYSDAYNNLGNLLLGQGRMEEAADCFRKAVQFKPDHFEALNNLGTVFQVAGDFDQAIECYKKSLARNPKYAEAHSNMGNSLKNKGQHTEAVVSYRRALQEQPSNGRFLNNLAQTLADAGEYQESMDAFDRAIAAEPQNPMIFSSRLYAMHFAPQIDPEKMFQEHLDWDMRFGAPLRGEIKPHQNDRNPDRRLRIGYVSADFREHPVANFLESFLPFHDAPKFEIFAYADFRKPDERTARFERMVARWRNITAMPDERVANLIRDDRIDILVDLAGHTSGNRLLVFARKPAPIQISYVGYPDTTGLSAMDYRITDAHADPPGATERFHGEQLLRMPESFLCFDPPDGLKMPSDPPAVGNGFVTFGSSNAMTKINGPMLQLWARILCGLPNSRLILKNRNLIEAGFQGKIRQLFAVAGVDPSRIELLPWALTRQRHLEFFERIDIALDTYPYHGTTVSCEGLWMGVPMLTMAGHIHLSRVGVSLLSNLGLQDWVAANPDEYVDLAIRKAADVDGLTRLRAELRQSMRDSILTNGKRFAGQIEELYRDVWHRWCGRGDTTA